MSDLDDKHIEQLLASSIWHNNLENSNVAITRIIKAVQLIHKEIKQQRASQHNHKLR